MKLSKKAEKLLASAGGIHIHSGKLRIVFKLPDSTKSHKRSLKLEPTEANILFAINKLGSIKQDVVFGLYANDPAAFWKKHFPEEKERAGLLSFTEACMLAYNALEHTWSANSRAAFTNAINRVSTHLGPIKVNDITVTQLKALQVHMIRGDIRTVSAGTVNYYFKLIRVLLDYYLQLIADRHRQVFMNPFSKVPTLKVGKDVTLSHEDGTEDGIFPFTPDEINAILAAAGAPLKNQLIRWVLYTGMRPGEVAALAWEDVDMQQGLIKLRYNVSFAGQHIKSPKTTSGYRTIELLPQALDVLNELVGVTDVLQPEPNTYIGAYDKQQVLMRRRVFLRQVDQTYHTLPTNIGLPPVTWRRILKRAGVPYRRMYQLRHTYASWLLMNGADVMWLARQMGHSDWGMIRNVYGRWIPKASVSPAHQLGKNLDSFVPISSPSKNAPE